MSEVAGRLAAQAGAYFLQDPFGGRAGLFIGSIQEVAPARISSSSGAVWSVTQAARVACGMGAEVTILDRSLRRLRELDEPLRRPRPRRHVEFEREIERPSLRSRTW